METNTKTHELYFNSANDPLGQMVINCDGITAARDWRQVEATQRVEAVKYIGRQVIPTVGRIGAAVGRGVLHVIESNR